MPEQAQSKYMDLNEFLETFFAAQDANENKIGYFPNMVKNNENVQSLYQKIVNFAQGLGPNTKKLYAQYWNARNDNSPAAQDFLNMVKNITFWYGDHYGHSDSRMPAETVMHLCRNGKIKNPEFALRLLKEMEGNLNLQMNADVLYMIATNPVAKPNDVYKYSSYLVRAQRESRPYDKNAPEELMRILNDQMVKTDANIDEELGKEVPNIDTIEKMGGGSLAAIAENILLLVEYQVKYDQRNPGDSDEIRNIVVKLQDKYNINNLLGSNKKPYGPKYEKQASLKLAKMEPEYQKMEQELGAAQKSQREIRRAYDEQIDEIRALQDKIAKLESELRNEKTKNVTLRATINTYVKDAEERANGSIVNVRKDMAEQLKTLKHYLDNNGPVKV